MTEATTAVEEATPTSPFTDDQRARVEALRVAKRTLGSSSVLSSSAPPEQFTVIDILRVAHYTLEGRDLLDVEDADRRATWIAAIVVAAAFVIVAAIVAGVIWR